MVNQQGYFMSKAQRIIDVANKIFMMSEEFESVEVNIDGDGGYVEIDGVEVCVDSDGKLTTTFSL